MLVNMAESAAPGRLEQVRTFLNTWRLPHDTRTPVDDLPDLARRARAWRTRLPDVPRPRSVELAELRSLRTALREVLGQRTPVGLRPLLDRYPVTVTVGEDRPVEYRPTGDGAVPALLVLVTTSVADGTWARLKACPDCRNVFYDHSRNRTRTWCAMYAETPDGRACGSIAKVRAYRDRRRG